jgi:hypothetical protein
MVTFQLPARLILAGGFAVAVAAAPVIAAFAVPTAGRPAPSIAACPSGESEDIFTNVCVPDLVPNSPAIQTAPGGLPEINGIPCTGANSGQCIGLAEEQQAEGPQPVPRSTVSSSP